MADLVVSPQNWGDYHSGSSGNPEISGNLGYNIPVNSTGVARTLRDMLLNKEGVEATIVIATGAGSSISNNTFLEDYLTKRGFNASQRKTAYKVLKDAFENRGETGPVIDVDYKVEEYTLDTTITPKEKKLTDLITKRRRTKKRIIRKSS